MAIPRRKWLVSGSGRRTGGTVSVPATQRIAIAWKYAVNVSTKGCRELRELLMRVTETKVVVITRYSGEDAVQAYVRFMQERRTGDIRFCVSQGSVQVVEFSETKRQPIEAEAVFAP